MPENRKRFREEITVTGNEGYALREESNTVNEVDGSKPGQIYTNTDFKYADPNSTYLILTGYLITRKTRTIMTPSVTETIPTISK